MAKSTGLLSFLHLLRSSLTHGCLEGTSQVFISTLLLLLLLICLAGFLILSSGLGLIEFSQVNVLFILKDMIKEACLLFHD